MLNITRTWNSVGAVRGDAPRPGPRPRLRRTSASRLRRQRSPTSRCTSTRWRRCRPSCEGAILLTFRAVELLGPRGGRDDDGGGGAAAPPAHADREGDDGQAGGGGRRARSSSRSAARATSRTRGCRASCATRRCCPSGRARRTCCRWICCARWARRGRWRPSSARCRAGWSTRTTRRARRRARKAIEAVAHARSWLEATAQGAAGARGGGAAVQPHGGAGDGARAAGRSRRVGGRKGEPRPAAAARRFARAGVDRIVDEDLREDARTLVGG